MEKPHHQSHTNNINTGRSILHFINMTKTQLKQLRTALKFGDITTIANEVGVSTVTVQSALRGDAMTPTANICIQHALKLVEQRNERLDYLKTVIRPMYAK